ncbi:agamous-like MADS-box protein AGL19 [Lotus japonicus]|uniref:agamous-like MADS-box protein AGL19 n=1 Tax=Lotus japonicus TaxID=34305 RepID=UPI00258E933C|nr:agamous-like MADS-box protein AGL19 [Lotus japonicus]
MVTFSKRKSGIFKKALELSILCGIQIAIILFSPGGNPFTFGSPSVEAVVNNFLYLRDEEQDIYEPSQNYVVYQINQQIEYLKDRIQMAAEKMEVVRNDLKNLDPLEGNNANLEELQKMKTLLIYLRDSIDQHLHYGKDAWEILRVAHEGTTRVRVSRLQLLTTQLENLKMKEDETVSEFHMRVRDMANASFALGEQMSEEKLVRKILRSLPKRLDMKVTTIEEAEDIGNIKVDELIGSLQTFEMSLNEISYKKNKSIKFVSNTEDDE